MSEQAGKVGILKRYLGKDYTVACPFIAPLILLIGALIAVPFMWCVWLSLHQKTIGQPAHFVGLSNFLWLIRDERFLRTIQNSFIFTFSSVSAKLGIGMVLALVLNQALFARNFWRGILLIPWVVPTIVTSISFRWLFHDFAGVINYLLISVGILDTPLAWLGTPGWSLFACIVANVWRDYPFFAVMLLAGIQAISPELYEVAKTDGASPWQQFVYITIPMLIPVILVILLINLIMTFNDFTIVHVMTAGGPYGTSEVFATLAYQLAFLRWELGKAVSIPVIQFPLLIFLILIIARQLTKTREI